MSNLMTNAQPSSTAKPLSLATAMSRPVGRWACPVWFRSSLLLPVCVFVALVGAPLAVAQNGAPDSASSAGQASGQSERAPAAVSDLAERLSADDPAARRQAARALADQGERAQAVVPQLIEALEDREPAVRFYAAHALGKAGDRNDNVIAALARRVGDPEPSIRLAAIESLRELVPDPAELVPLAADILNQEDQVLASRAVEAIILRGEKAVPFLVEALQNERAAYWACLAIEELGEVASPTAPQLRELLVSTEDSTLKLHAILALANLGPAAEIAHEEIVAALRPDADTAEQIQRAAAYAAGKLGLKEAEPQLKRGRESDDELLAMISVWALARLEPDDPERVKAAVDHLVEGLASEDPMTRMAATKGLDTLSLPSDLVAAKLSEALDEADSTVAFNVVDTLAQRGEPAAIEAGKALMVPEKRELAVEVLKRLGPAAEVAVPQMIAALEDATGTFREKLQDALRSVGAGAAPATAELMRSLDDSEQSIRTSALLALGSIGPSAAEAKSKLLESIQSREDRFERIATAWAAARVAPNDARVASAAVPALIDGLSFPSGLVQAEAVTTLGMLGSAARPALKPLQELAEDSEAPDELRTLAKQAIEAIR